MGVLERTSKVYLGGLYKWLQVIPIWLFLLFVFLFVFFLWDNFTAIKCKLLEFSLVELEESDSESCGCENLSSDIFAVLDNTKSSG